MSKNYCCIKCGELISSDSAMYGTGRCWKCYSSNCSGKQNNNFKGGWENKLPNCIDCGKKLKGMRNKRCWYCNLKYKKTLYIDYGNRSGKNNSNFRGGKPKCIDCGKELNGYKKGVKRCRSCWNIYLRGENNPNWKDGISFLPYSSDWTVKLKIKIRTRDNFTCQYCGMTEEENLQKFNRCLTIHHIDYNKQNCKEDNLITLCVCCNSKANKNRDYWYSYYKYIIDNKLYEENI